MQSPLHRIEHHYSTVDKFSDHALFALANTGVHVGNISEVFTNRESPRLRLDLLFGKAAGISSFAWVAVKLGIASLPQQVNWKQVFGASCLCGIGFTMSLFIAGLAFEKGELLDMAKIGILAASGAAGVMGTLVLKLTHQNTWRLRKHRTGCFGQSLKQPICDGFNELSAFSTGSIVHCSIPLRANGRSPSQQSARLKRRRAGRFQRCPGGHADPDGTAYRF